MNTSDFIKTNSCRIVGFAYSLYFIILGLFVLVYFSSVLKNTDRTDMIFPIGHFLLASVYYLFFTVWSIRIFRLNKTLKEERISLLVIGIFGVSASLYFIVNFFE